MTEPCGSSVSFSIDVGKSFSLPPRLAQLFQFIASGDKDGSGKVASVRWRSRMEISPYMEKLAGKTITPSYVNGMVHRLRQILQKSGYDPMLIQTHRQKGVRLAIKLGTLGPPHLWLDADTSTS